MFQSQVSAFGGAPALRSSDDGVHRPRGTPIDLVHAFSDHPFNDPKPIYVYGSSQPQQLQSWSSDNGRLALRPSLNHSTRLRTSKSSKSSVYDNDAYDAYDSMMGLTTPRNESPGPRTPSPTNNQNPLRSSANSRWANLDAVTELDLVDHDQDYRTPMPVKVIAVRSMRVQADTRIERPRDEIKTGWQAVSPAKPQREVREMTLATHSLTCRQLLRSGQRDKVVHLTAPKDGLVRCFIRRDMGVFGLGRSYEMRTEDSSMFLLSACEWQSDKGNSLKISQTLEGKYDKGAAQLNVSHSGMEYSLWGKSKPPSHSTAQAVQYDEFGNVLQASADPVVVAAGPAVRIQVFKVNKPFGMTVTLPLPLTDDDDLSDQPTSRFSSATSLAPRRDRTTDVAVLVKRGLRADKRSHRYEGRQPVKSNKNFQLVYWTEANSPEAKVVLQVSKVADAIYALDFGYPFTAETAFATALAAMVNRIGQ